MKTYSRSYSDKQGTHVCKHTNMMRVANKHPHTHTRTQWGLEVCHARWQRHAWRMALSTVVHATESQRVCSSTSFTRQWYRKDGCHTGKKITHLPGLWKPNKKTKCDRTENLWDGGEKTKQWMTDSFCSSHGDNMIELQCIFSHQGAFVRIVLPSVHR